MNCLHHMCPLQEDEPILGHTTNRRRESHAGSESLARPRCIGVSRTAPDILPCGSKLSKRVWNGVGLIGGERGKRCDAIAAGRARGLGSRECRHGTTEAGALFRTENVLFVLRWFVDTCL